MDARQRVGVVLVVAGVALALVGAGGAVGVFGGPAAATGSPTPAPNPTAAAIATAPAMTVAAPTVVPATVAPPTAIPTEDTLAIVTAFFAELEHAVQIGAQETMTDNLGQATIDRYGRDECSTNLAIKEPVPEQAFEILALSPPAAWDYVTDELTTTVPDAITVRARVTGPDATGGITTAERELHIQVLDGIVYWFTDCGTPLVPTP
jgi:hypothetical protein